MGRDLDPLPITYGRDPLPITYGRDPLPITYGRDPLPITCGRDPLPITYGRDPLPITYGRDPLPITYGRDPLPITYGRDPLPITYGRDPLPITYGRARDSPREETIYRPEIIITFTKHGLPILWQRPFNQSPMAETLYQSLWQRPFTNHLWQSPGSYLPMAETLYQYYMAQKSPMAEAQTIPSFCPLQVLYSLPLNHSKVLIYQWPTVRPAGWVLSVYNNNYITVTEHPRGAIFFLFPWKQHGLP